MTPLSKAIAEATWQPIETAPKDGTVVLSFWRDVPVFIAWFDGYNQGEKRVEGIWPFRRTVSASRAVPGAWRVVTFSVRHDEWLIAGNYAPFNPRGFQWLPAPPVSS